MESASIWKWNPQAYGNGIRKHTQIIMHTEMESASIRKWNSQAYENGIRKHTQIIMHTKMESASIRKWNPHVLSHVVFTKIESASSVSCFVLAAATRLIPRRADGNAGKNKCREKRVREKKKK